MELTCFVYEGWRPLLRPANSRRDWMDESPESFAYRCLPLSIANAGGWELLSPCGFEAEWNGGPRPEDVVLRVDEGSGDDRPVALFGVGAFTLHVPGLFRTEPGWNLLVTGPPNLVKDGVAPLTGVIETDWSPYSFTINWRLTRPHHAVRFEAGEPICWFTPIVRSAAEQTVPRIEPIETAPELKRQFEAWSASRDAFHRQVAADPPTRPTDKWQKLYYRGVDPDGRAGVADHQSKLRLKPFAGAAACPHTGAARPAPAREPVSPISDGRALKKAWIASTREHLRRLSALVVRRVAGVGAEDFLADYYAINRPVVLGGFAAEWPARRWSANSMAERIGSVPVQHQGDREWSGDYERLKDTHLREAPFDTLVRSMEGAGNDAYVTAYNASANRQALAPLFADLGHAGGGVLDEQGARVGMLWIGGRTFTPLHHDLTNNLLVQVVGSKRVILVPPDDGDRLYNTTHVFSDVRDLEAADLKQHPALDGLHAVAVDLQAGDALFLPIGWWHQVRSAGFSVSLTCTNFSWPNTFHEDFPSE